MPSSLDFRVFIYKMGWGAGLGKIISKAAFDRFQMYL